uniref:Uncharacterized protein n=1 Tax=Caenorhabditis japonica TaxID=281687 RepID=A0A8R1DWP0_CAEJA
MKSFSALLLLSAFVTVSVIYAQDAPAPAEAAAAAPAESAAPAEPEAAVAEGGAAETTKATELAGVLDERQKPAKIPAAPAPDAPPSETANEPPTESSSLFAPLVSTALVMLGMVMAR